MKLWQSRLFSCPQLLAMVVLLSSLLAACAESKASVSSPPTDSEVQRYALKGQVVAANVKHHKVVIAHEDIPGYMEAMTMPFTLLDEQVLRVLKRGDRVQATLMFESQTNRTWLENFVVTEKSTAGPPAAVQ